MSELRRTLVGSWRVVVALALMLVPLAVLELGCLAVFGRMRVAPTYVYVWLGLLGVYIAAFSIEWVAGGFAGEDIPK